MIRLCTSSMSPDGKVKHPRRLMDAEHLPFESVSHG
jgi:hypothetical protein